MKTLIIVILLTITYPLFSLEHTEQYENTAFAVHSSDEECLFDQDDKETQDYDQHVCEKTPPPAISPAKAFLTEVAVNLFIRYLNFKECVESYFSILKNKISNFFKAKKKLHEINQKN